MTPAEFHDTILMPSAACLPDMLNTKQAHCMMLAIAGQESAWRDRVQINGPARGFWQIEQLGMFQGVLNSLFMSTLEKVLDRYSVPVDYNALFEALAWHDPVSHAVARLGLFMDRHPLPQVGDEDGAWDTYLRVWRPGKPDRERWRQVYGHAVKVMHP